MAPKFKLENNSCSINHYKTRCRRPFSIAKTQSWELMEDLKSQAWLSTHTLPMNSSLLAMTVLSEHGAIPIFPWPDKLSLGLLTSLVLSLLGRVSFWLLETVVCWDSTKILNLCLPCSCMKIAWAISLWQNMESIQWDMMEEFAS